MSGLRKTPDMARGGDRVRPLLYISGPYSTGNGRTVAENIAVARAHAVAAAKKGWMPLCPHLNTAGFEVDCPEISHEEWLAGDITILRSLDPAGAAMLLLPGWEESKGAGLERDWAICLNLEIFEPPATPEAIPPAAAFRGIGSRRKTPDVARGGDRVAHPEQTKPCPRCGGRRVGYCIDLDDQPTGELFCVRCGAVWEEAIA